MPAGLPYFAWIDAGETTFTSGHLRWDEAIFSFTLSQDEGDPASLTIVVRRPRNVSGYPIGLLGPGRKIWCWFALDCGPALVTFRGRLVGIPTSIFEDLVTLEFVARPSDVVAQKEALAASLRVLPYYDEAVIDPARGSDPDVVLEGYTKIWHYDRSSHVVTVSDEITGEDGLVEFDGVSEDGKVLYDGLGLTLTSGPLSRVDVSAEYMWTQQASGGVDLTGFLVGSWPAAVTANKGAIQFKASDWPKHGAALGEGWVVADASATDLMDFSTHTSTTGATIRTEEGETSYSRTDTFIFNAGNVKIGPAIINDEWSGETTETGSSASHTHSESSAALCIQEIKPTLVAGYTAGRQYTERVSFSLIADVQPILTDPEDGEALRIDDIKSANLTESGIIGDPRWRSYIATERGNSSLEHLIVLARAHLMKRARVVEISFAPKLSRMPEITLRKNVYLSEPRVGQALGKIIGYSIALDGSDGRINCEVRIGCTIGRGGAAVATDGAPVYASLDYVGYDYQQFIGRTVLIDASVGYEQPIANPNDDGINFLGSISIDSVIESPLVFTFGADDDDAEQPAWGGWATGDDAGARSEYIRNALKQYQVKATFKLKSMTRDFSTDYTVQVTDLKIPLGIDLEAV